ncbi:C4-dicarboxylate ABC transporter permease [Lachnospiraceae bacterium oral taxon 500]|nr:C4-dicarboxylate ABC transporter permease [Lachnospiraceae bacterium oral taxon 500]
MSDTIISALGQLFTIQNLIFANIGIFIGIIFGSIPGLNGNLAITVLLPFTFQMDTIPALLLLTAIFFGANFGGSISSILINTPGTNAAAATLIDGYPMCRNGQPQKALDMALIASTVGGLISALCLLFFSPQISKVAIRFGSPEYFALAIFGLSVIASVSGKSIIKGLISGGMGILLSTIGLDSVSGLVRFSFGNLRLYNGVKMLSVLLGVYAIAQMIGRINQTEVAVASTMQEKNKEDRITVEDVKKTLPTMLKSSLIGAFIGAVPGTGGAIASFIAYNEAARCKKAGDRFGQGEIKGIAAPESANNGATAATLIPLLTLGIPGDVVAATLLGAFTMHGLVVGPKLFVDSGPVVYAVLIGCVISQVIMFLQGKYLLKLFVKITHVPQDLLTAVLVVICCAGAFAISGSEMDVYIMLLFGGIAYLMQKVDFPPVPIVLGMVLGPIAESNLRNALVMSGGSWFIFIRRPICLAFIILTIVLIVLLKKGEAKQRKMEEKLLRY